MKKKVNLESICQGLLSMPFRRMKAFVNWVMATCSSPSDTQSVVSLSWDRHFHYHYSNMSKVSAYFCKSKEEYEKGLDILLSYFLKSCGVSPFHAEHLGNYYSFSQDMCMVSKPASPCLEGKVFGHQSSRLGTRIVEGYKACFTHIWLGKGWSVPVRIEVLEGHSKPVELAKKQLEALMEDDTLGFNTCLCINNADSGYGNAAFLSPLYKHPNLINIVRLRAGTKVYPCYKGEQKAKSNPKIYGDTYYLSGVTVVKQFMYKNRKTKEKITKEKTQTSVMDYDYNDFSEENIVLGNGKKAVRKIWRWKDMLIRTKNKNNMKDKPFDLLKIEIWNEDKSAKIFERDMFLAVSGQSKDKLNAVEACENYRTRFDVEGYYRFSKQHLFLGKFQTPDKQHFLNHLLVIFSAMWLLYGAREEVGVKSPVWQQYLGENKRAAAAQRKGEKAYLSPSQVQKGMADLFDTFDQTPYLPSKYKKGKGREKGTKMPERKRHPTFKKNKKEVMRA